MSDIVKILRREMWYQPEFKMNQSGKPNQTFELTRTNLIAADKIERLRSERDEARRLVCELAAEYKAEMFCPKGTIVPKSDRALAKAYGWDCYKENA